MHLAQVPLQGYLFINNAVDNNKWFNHFGACLFEYYYYNMFRRCGGIISTGPPVLAFASTAS
jgi:hypothetical protein